MTHDVLVILPTYNEAENLRRIVPLLLGVDPRLGVLVVDDASPDGTGAIAEDLSNQHPGRILIVHRAAKLGLGGAYVAGFERALLAGSELIITMDADLSHHPRYIPHLLDLARNGADLVIGSRYVGGGAAPDFPLRRKLLSWSANFVAHTVVGLEARDATAGFRCFRRHVLESVAFREIKSSGYSFLVEMLFLVQRAGFRVAEYPIVFEDRTHGASKISRSEIRKAVHTVAQLGLQRLRAAITGGGGERA